MLVRTKGRQNVGNQQMLTRTKGVKIYTVNKYAIYLKQETATSSESTDMFELYKMKQNLENRQVRDLKQINNTKQRTTI